MRADHRRNTAVGLSDLMLFALVFGDDLIFAFAVFAALADAEFHPFFQPDPLDFVETPAQFADVLQPESGERE
ncbi:MAG: hypothetical protein R3C26_02585 [Calditrichia bacterium]